MTEIILAIIGGLVLFLYAVNSLSETIKTVVGDATNKWIIKFTSTTFSSIIVGLVSTALLDSSSAVIIITIVFVNSKILTFRQAMGIVLGANIGTTISSQIIAMDIGKYSPLLLVIGFVLLLLSKSERINNMGKIILYFGVLFFGLLTMENAVVPLKGNAYFLELLRTNYRSNYWCSCDIIHTIIISNSRYGNITFKKRSFKFVWGNFSNVGCRTWNMQ